MEFIIICTVAMLAALLTFFSGFGLGTLLMPVFALFFPVPVAIAATAVVHLASNVFKVFLIGTHANWSVVRQFAIPAAITALFGASLLFLFEQMPPLLEYSLGDRHYQITAVKLIIGILIILFALLDLLPNDKISFAPKYLPLGGAFSGFFGGLSGMQGALRAAFLIKLGLSKEAFIATGVICAVVVDISRLLSYGIAFSLAEFAQLADIATLVIAATLSAFLGNFIGKQLLKKVTLRTVQMLVGALLSVIGVGLCAGVW
jgi:uncharacterized membrane protein YfcA